MTRLRLLALLLALAAGSWVCSSRISCCSGNEVHIGSGCNVGTGD